MKVLGISADPPESHARFAKALGLRFDLLADTDLEVARRYGVFAQTPDGGFATRSVFLVDREGKLRHADRDFRIPRKLAGTPLGDALDALARADDPLAALADLPEPERSGKRMIGRLVQCVLARDVDGVGTLLHPAFGAAPGKPGSAAEGRRRALDGWRRTFATRTVPARRLDELVDLADAAVLDRDGASGEALRDRGAETRRLATGLLKGDLLAVVRCRGLAAEDGTPVLGKEIALVLRKEGEEWRIAALCGF